MTRKKRIENRKSLRAVYLEAKDKAANIAKKKGISAAESYVRSLKEKWERTGSDLDKKAYDGARRVAKVGANVSSYEIPDGPIDVLMITQNDWSNTGYRFSKCLELLGLTVVFIKGKKHMYGYPVQGPIDPALAIRQASTYPWVVRPEGLGADRIRGLMRRAKVIHFHGSTYTDVGIINELKDKFAVVQHGGTTYRQKPKLSNNIFNKFVNATIIQCPDLLGLGAKNEHLIYYPVQTELITPNYERMGEKILIGHHPSNPRNKGTKDILAVINKLEANPEFKDKFEYIGTKETKKMGRRSWEANLELMSRCDILIETMQMKQGAKVFGEWGNTAIEAASLGKIVVTNSKSTDIYRREYGGCALNIVNNKSQLEKTLVRLLQMSDKELKKEKMRTRAWVVENHSMEANAKRLWEKVYSKFFPELEDQIRSKFWK